MTLTFWKRIFPEASAECAMFGWGEEDCSCLFLCAHLPGRYGPTSRPHEWMLYQQRPIGDLSQWVHTKGVLVRYFLYGLMGPVL